jgi:hypothetical protein
LYNVRWQNLNSGAYKLNELKTKWRKLKSEPLLSTSVRMGCPIRKSMKTFMDTIGKKSPSYSTMKKWAAKFKRGRESI